MKTHSNRRIQVLACSLAASLAVVSPAGAFDVGNVLVEKIGDGAAALSSAGSALFVQEFNPITFGLAATYALPTSGPNQISDAGSATSAGYGNLTTDGLQFLLPGYDAAPGMATVASAAGVARTIGILDKAGTISSLDLTPTTAYSGSNFRSVIGDGAGNYWGAGTTSGGTGGSHYIDSTGNATQISTSVTNTRVTEIYAGQLYSSASSGAFVGVSTVGTGTPTTAGQAFTLQIATGAGSSPYGFFLADTNLEIPGLDTAWIADDRSGAGGGISKWTFDGTIWTQAYTLRIDTTAGTTAGSTGSFSTTTGGGLRGLSGIYDSTTGATTLYATTAANSNNLLIGFTDPGAAPSQFTVIASAGTNQAFRGVDFVAVPEPGSALLMLLGGAGLLLRRRHS